MREIKISLVFFLLVLLLTGCSRNRDSDLILRIAHFPNATHAQAMIIKHNQLLEKYLPENIEVSYIVFNAGASEIEGFFSNHVDIGYIGPIPAINGHIKSNGDIKIVSGSAFSGAKLVVGVDTSIESISDLQNHRVAVPQFGNTQHIALINLLSLYDLSDRSRGGNVEIFFAKNSEMAILFEKNDIDAAYVPEPWASDLIAQGLARTIGNTTWLENDATTLIISNDRIISNKPEWLEAFLLAHLEATDLIKNDREQAKKIVAMELEAITGKKISPTSIDEAFENVSFDLLPPVESVDLYMEWFYDSGFIDQRVDVHQLFALEFLDRLMGK